MEQAPRAIIGSGLIGRAWAMVFARAGWQAALYDAVDGVADTALELIAEGLARACATRACRRSKGRAPPACARRKASRMRSMARAMCRRTCRRRSRPSARFSPSSTRSRRRTRSSRRSTSAIVASLFTENLKGRARCLVAHPVNPPHLVPIVELVGAPWTAPETIARARDGLRAIGQVPIVVRREIDGFILNRLQGALLVRGVPAGRRRLCVAAGPRQDASRTASACAGRSWGRSRPSS